MLHVYHVDVLVLTLLTIALSGGMIYLISRLLHLKAHVFIIIILGLIPGLIIGALVSYPLSKLPGTYGQLLPIIVTSIVAIGSSYLMYGRADGFSRFFTTFPTQVVAMAGAREAKESAKKSGPKEKRILVDTSVIIDGRLYDLVQTGFIPGRLVVPRFVLAEIQRLSDSDDAQKRARGRRGLEMLGKLKKETGLELSSEDVPEIPEVDAKLVSLAVSTRAEILTTDYNLNQVASVEGIKVLNINELSGVLRPVVLPGEELTIEIVQPGKEKRQGVGYLPDGTMVVVEGGDTLIGQTVALTVNRSLQTVAGKMIFASPTKGKSSAHAK